MTLVWYVSYGSNMAADRLACYLRGGTPPGGARAHPGARDPRPPRRAVALDLPGTVYFAGESGQWGGGMAFYDHAETRGTAARGYLVTAGQLADIAAQEMHRTPAAGDPVEELVSRPLAGGRCRLGPGRYETLVDVGRHEDRPLLTLTSPHGHGHVPHTAPAPAYLDQIRQGLRESRGWSDAAVSAYVSSLANSPVDEW